MVVGELRFLLAGLQRHLDDRDAASRQIVRRDSRLRHAFIISALFQNHTSLVGLVHNALASMPPVVIDSIVTKIKLEQERRDSC